MDKTKTVVIREYNNEGEAQLFQALLRSAGIDAYLENDVIASVLPVLEVRLVVLEKDKQRAEQILSSKFDNEEFREESGESNPL